MTQAKHLDHIVDVLLSLPGIAIVELPEGGDVGQGWTHYAQLCELITMLDELPGDAREIMADHIDPDALIDAAIERTRNAMQTYLANHLDISLWTVEFIHQILAAAFMDGFAAGVGWGRLRAGAAQ
jgi:hypothetical protein